ncbi:hypothetical protein [Nonomuraea sp. NPDC002799]
MPNAKSSARDQAKGCGCLATVFLIAAGCNALSVSNDPTLSATYSPPPIPSRTTSLTPEPVDDLNDSIEDHYENDKDGEGVMKTGNRHDRYPSTGRRQPKRTRPTKPKPVPVAKTCPGWHLRQLWSGRRRIQRPHLHVP